MRVHASKLICPIMYNDGLFSKKGWQLMRAINANMRVNGLSHVFLLLKWTGYQALDIPEQGPRLYLLSARPASCTLYLRRSCLSIDQCMNSVTQHNDTWLSCGCDLKLVPTRPNPILEVCWIPPSPKVAIHNFHPYQYTNILT